MRRGRIDRALRRGHPRIPTLEENIVTIPTTEGVEYRDKQGNILEGKIALKDNQVLDVIAHAKPGYAIKSGAASEWTFEYVSPKVRRRQDHFCCFHSNRVEP